MSSDPAGIAGQPGNSAGVTSLTPTSLIEYVARSPKLCAAHDRAGWIGLFATDGEVKNAILTLLATDRKEEAMATFWSFLYPRGFWAWVDRYPQAEKAKGYLLGWSAAARLEPPPDDEVE